MNREDLNYDYIANHYYEMSNWELKELLLSSIHVALNNLKSENEFYKLLIEELDDREFFQD